MPPTPPQREVIEISDSPTPQPEVIEISDDENTGLSNHQAKQINIPHIPPVQPPCEPKADGNPESVKPELVDIKGPDDALMVSLGVAMSFQSFSSANEHPAGKGSCLDVLDRELAEISREIKEDDASQTTQMLQGADSQHQPIPTGIENEEYSIQSIESLRQGPEASSSVAIVHHGTKKTRPTMFLQGERMQCPENAVPKYNSYVEIYRSRLANDTRLPFEPSDLDINSHSKEVVDAAILRSQVLCAKLAEQSQRSEILACIGAYLPQIRSAYQDCRNSLDREGLYVSLDHKDANHPSYHVDKAFGIPLGTFLDIETTTAKPQKPTVSPDLLANPLERYAREGCLICSAHQCHIHGKFDDSDGENDSNLSDAGEQINRPSATYQPYSMPLTRMWTSYSEGNSIEDDESEGDNDCDEQRQRYYCSASCRLNPSSAKLTDKGTWTQENDASIQVLAALKRMGRNRKASCLIATMLGKPCSEVYLRLKKLRIEPVGPDDMVARDGRKSKKFDWRDLETEYKHDKRLQPRPCYHPGQNCFVAGEKCTCVSNGICCDKFCTCPQSCDARYRGCTCNGPCILQCTCRQLNRECDPDLCHKCSVAESIRSQGPIPNTNCHNCEIQRAQGKKVLVGESSIEGIGNGLYLAEPVQDGDFIAEYVGEIIGNAEVERRNAVVKRVENSYIFDLNAEVAIDAMWFGNATRFINHSEVRKNLRPKVLLVNSEHRIGFFASKNIDAGEELFFNYGKDFKRNEKLTEVGVVSSNAGRKSAQQHGLEPSSPIIEKTEAGMGSGINEEDEQEEEQEDFTEWLARTQRKRASDDDDDYIERGSQQEHKRSRTAIRNRRGRR